MQTNPNNSNRKPKPTTRELRAMYEAKPKRLERKIRKAQRDIERTKKQLQESILGNLNRQCPAVDALQEEDDQTRGYASRLFQQARSISNRAAKLEKHCAELSDLYAYRDGQMTRKEELIAWSDRFEMNMRMEAERERREGR